MGMFDLIKTPSDAEVDYVVVGGWIRQLFEPLPEGDSGAAPKIAPKRATATHGG